VGSYIHYSDSLHLYCRDINKIGIDQEKEIENSDSLSLDRNESERIFKEIYNRMIALTNTSISEKEISYLAQLKSEYTAYDNIMLMIAAYVAKKLHNNDLVNELTRKCSNSAYTAMWNRWANRASSKNN
jgi:thymidylate synthase